MTGSSRRSASAPRKSKPHHAGCEKFVAPFEEITPSALAGPGVSRPTARTAVWSKPVSCRMLASECASASTATSGPSLTRLGVSTIPSTRNSPDASRTVALFIVPPLSRPTTTQRSTVPPGSKTGYLRPASYVSGQRVRQGQVRPGIPPSYHPARPARRPFGHKGVRLSDGRPSRRVPSQAGRRAHARAGTRRAAALGAGRHVRDPAAPRPAAALGPAVGARRRARLLGRAARAAPRPEDQPPRRTHGGPPAGVRGLRGRDPGRRVRRWQDDHLRPRHVHDGEVARRRGDRGLRRSAYQGQVRAVPHARQGLDGAPDGPAGAVLVADARAGPAHAAGAGRPAAPAGERLGVRDALGRYPGARLRLRRPAAAGLAGRA